MDAEVFFLIFNPKNRLFSIFFYYLCPIIWKVERFVCLQPQKKMLKTIEWFQSNSLTRFLIKHYQNFLFLNT